MRFPEGMYAQDTAIVGHLYVRMNKVADIDVNLYNWLQRPESVTHQKRDFAFHHDHITAASDNFRLCLDRGVLPMRSYYTLIGELEAERGAPDFHIPENQQQYETDRQEIDTLLANLTRAQHMRCAVIQCIRLFEKYIYDRRIKNMR